MMKKFKIQDIPSVEERLTQCQGQIFRGRKSIYQTERGIAQTIKLNHLKSKSCPGCEHCAWIFDNLTEVNSDWPIIDFDQIEEGKFYKIIPTNLSTDWETGLIASYDLRVVFVDGFFVS